MADFMQYRDLWKLWRSLGHYDGNESWVAPISFLEATQVPNKRMLDTFFEMDDFFERMKRHRRKKQGK